MNFQAEYHTVYHSGHEKQGCFYSWEGYSKDSTWVRFYKVIVQLSYNSKVVPRKADYRTSQTAHVQVSSQAKAEKKVNQFP